ncbi:MAG: caspase family protein [Caldilineaceae bacterium]
MNYSAGLQQLQALLQKRAPTELSALATLQDRFRKNQRAAQIFGSSENTRNEHSQVIYALNELALAHTAYSFNELCTVEFAAAGEDRVADQTKGGGDVPPSAPPVYGKGERWAVLVGANHYLDPIYAPLASCVADVQNIHAQLLQGGFSAERTHLITDNTTLPTREKILATLKAVADATAPDDLLLFYYSGHGDLAGDESYLVTRNGWQTVLSDTGLAVKRVKAILEAAPARAKVLILDACHSGAALGQKGAKPMSAEFIRRVFAEAEGLAILTSCQQGQVSWEAPEFNGGVFTHFLRQALAGDADWDGKGFVTVQDASRYVVDGVKLWASNYQRSQTPTLQYSVAGDIILTRL